MFTPLLLLLLAAAQDRTAAEWWQQGTALYEQDRYAEAAEAFAHVTQLEPQRGTPLVMLGLCEYKLGRPGEALEHLQAGKRLGITDDPQLRRVAAFHEGLLLMDRGDFEAARHILAGLSRDGVVSGELAMALGMAAMRVRPSRFRPGDALEQIVRRAGRAESLGAQRKVKEGIAEYEGLVQEFGTERNVQFAFGKFLLDNHEDDRAVAAFERELANTPGHLLARLGIAGIQARLDPRAGLPFAEQAVQLNPKLPEAHYVLGYVLLETGETARALEELELASRGVPEDPRVWFALGRAYSRLGRKTDAERARENFNRLSR
jgi:Flp pilus assembly protein TadD